MNDANGFRLAYIYAREEQMMRLDHLSPAEAQNRLDDGAAARGMAEGLGGIPGGGLLPEQPPDAASFL